MYCAKTDILNQMSEQTLAQLTSESGDVIDDIVVSAVITDADSLVDSYCGGRYTLPFSPVPARVKNCSVAIAIYNLYSRRPAMGGVNESIRKNYEDVVSFLKDISTGKAIIDGAAKPTANVSATGGEFKANDRVFTDDSMKGM